MKSKSIELLAFDRNHNLQYQGKCKIRIDRLSEMLLVEPVNEEYKMRSAMFKWDFVMDKNILFIFGEHEFTDFALVFDEDKRCKKVYDFIIKDKPQSAVKRVMIYNRFLLPIFTKISEDNGSISPLKHIIASWIDNHDNKEKEEYIKLLKEMNVYEIVYSSVKVTDDQVKKQGGTSNSGVVSFNLRKRRYCHVKPASADKTNTKRNNHILPVSCKKQRISKNFSITVNHSMFKLMNVQIGRKMLQKLLIFFSTQTKHCYEYSLCYKRKLYFCIGCKAKGESIAAVFDKDENGFNCIKMEDKGHVCAPIQYSPDNYIEIKVIRKPNYEILENCNTASGKILIIFNQNDRSKCWEFRNYTSSIFKCRHCHTVAKVWNSSTEKEYIELQNASHKCKFVPYEPKKYYQFKEFVLSSDFEIESVNGVEKKKIIIFDKTDRSLCYVYILNGQRYYCIGCNSKGSGVHAKLLQNSEGEDYVILSNKKHICKLRPYMSLKKVHIILHSSDFKIIDDTVNGVKKLLVFDSNDRSLCYTFSYNKYKKTYYCLGCGSILKYNSKPTSINYLAIHLKLCKDENGENILQLNDGKHICKPKKYQPEIYENIKCYDYFFFRHKNWPDSLNVAIHHPENRKLCFKFAYIKSNYFYFQCVACQKKHKSFVTKMKKDENGKEYFNHDYKKHVCQAVNLSSIHGPHIILLKRGEINIKEKKEKKLPDIDESRIIKFPDFQLHRSLHGVEDGLLFIFHSEDPSLGYKFYYDNSKNKYQCLKRRHVPCNASAKLQIDKDGEKYLILGKAEHKCEPLKYENIVVSEKQTINASDFVTFPTNGVVKEIILFTSSERNECYEFVSYQQGSVYYCRGCRALKKQKYVGAKLCKNEDDQLFLQISKEKEHFCKPLKYDPKKYENK